MPKDNSKSRKDEDRREDADDDNHHGPKGLKLKGTQGDDFLVGGVGSDRIKGGSGDDVISGGAGNDRIFGGRGNDTIDGGDGSDRIDGGRGDDRIDGGSGADRIKGGSGDDVIAGGDGDDRINGGHGDDNIDGGVGDDRIKGGSGDDVIFGGNGNDRIDGGRGDDVIDGGSGDDVIRGGSGDDLIFGGDGNDRLDGGSGADVIDGGAGDDSVEGGEGADVVSGGSGNDIVEGGEGADTGIYTMQDNFDSTDIYDGGEGGEGGASADTLQLNLTYGEALDADIVADVAAFEQYISDHANDGGEGGEGGEGGYEFSTMGLTASNWEHVNVNLINTGPEANADTGETDEDNSVVIDVLANDEDSDHLDVLTVDLVSVTSGGGGASIVDNQVVYDPGQGYQYLAVGETAAVEVTYTISDIAGAQSTSTVAITVTGTNDGPVAVADRGTTDENAAITVNVLANDTDVDLSDTHTVDSVSVPAGQGSVAIAANQVEWTPGTDFDYLAINESATVVIDYTMSDNHNAASSSTLTLTVTGSNDGPVAVADAATTDENVAITVDVLANDTDLDLSDTHTVDSVSVPAGQGTVAIVGNQVKWMPGTDFDYLAVGESAMVVIDYTMSDNHNASSSSTLTLTVTGSNDGPVAVADTSTTDENAAITVDVRANDTDKDLSDTHTVDAVSVPAGQGTVAIVGNQVKWMPGADFDYLAVGESATVTVNYTMSDNHNASSSSTLTLTVAGTNDQPVVTDVSNAMSETDGVQTFSGQLSASDVDVTDGHAFAQVANSLNVALPAGVTLESPVSATVNPDGSYNVVGDFDALADGETATVTLQYTATDDSGATNAESISKTVTLTVTGTNDQPVVTDVSHGLGETEGVQTFTGQLSESDVDVTDAHSFAQVANSLNVALPADVTLESPVSATVNPDGSFNVAGDFDALADGETATITFQYTATDDSGAANSESAPKTVTLTVTGTNDQPNITDVSNSLTETNGVQTFSGQLTASDVDATDAHTFAQMANSLNVALPAGVTLESPVTVTVNPDGSYGVIGDFDALAVGETATVTFQYTASDDSAAADAESAPKTVTLTVTGTNDIPVANTDTDLTAEDAAIVIPIADLLINDMDVDNNDVRSLTSISNALNGTVALNGLGNIIFTPAGNHSGPASFDYTISDGNGGTSKATVNIDVTAVADTPTLTVTDADTYAGIVIPLDIASALTDTDGSETLSIEVSGIPSGSTLSAGTQIADDGSSATWSLGSADLANLTLSPSANSGGIVTFTVTAKATEVSNGDAASTTATMDVTINRPPTANDDTVLATEDTPITITAATLLCNDIDLDPGDVKSISTVEPIVRDASGNAVGTAALTTGGDVLFTPNANWNGTANFDYTMSDRFDETSSATVTVNVAAVNDAPVSHGDGQVIVADTAGTVSLGRAIPTDIEGDALSITVDSVPDASIGVVRLADGSAVNNGQALTIEHLIGAQFETVGAGSGAFSYSVSDGQGGFDTATLDITVNASGNNETVNVAVIGTRSERLDEMAIQLNDSSVFDIQADVNRLDYRIPGTTNHYHSYTTDEWNTFLSNYDAVVFSAGHPITPEVGSLYSCFYPALDNFIANGGGIVGTGPQFRYVGIQDYTPIDGHYYVPASYADPQVTILDSSHPITSGISDYSSGYGELLWGNASADPTATVLGVLNDSASEPTTNVAIAYDIVGSSRSVFLGNHYGRYSLVVSTGVEDQLLEQSVNWAGNGQRMSIDGGNGHDVLAGGVDNDMLTGGAGNDLFVLADGYGGDTITDFQAGPGAGDVLDITGFGFQDFNDVMASTFQNGADTVIQLDADDSVTLRGVNMNDLVQDDILINRAPIAYADSVATDENAAIIIDVLANDTDADVNDGPSNFTLVSIDGLIGGGLASISGNRISFDPETDFDHLLEGETVTVIIDYTMSDSHGAASNSTVTLTVTGSNDAPVIGVADTSGGVTEIADGAAGENASTHSESGTIFFTDVELADAHTLTVNPSGTNYRGSLTAVVSDAATGDGSGAITWTYTVADAALDDLATGETLTQSYTVTIDDGNGGTASETVTVTIEGANDTLTGVVVDGYIAGATVFADADNDGVLDSGEASDITDSAGNFELVDGIGALVMTGGVDVATGLAFDGVMRAPAGSTVVTPLTTLISTLVGQGQTQGEAESLVQQAFAIPATTSITETDPVAATLAGDPAGAALFSAGAQVLNTVLQAAALIDGAGTVNYADALAGTFDAMADLLSNTNGALDLTSTTDIGLILGDAATTLGVDISTTQEDAVTVIAQSANAVETAVNGATDADALLTSVTQVSIVAQGPASQALGQAGASGDASAAVQAYSGTALDDAVADAASSVGNVDGINDAPVAVDDVFSGDEDAMISGNVLTNDDDIDGDTLSAIPATITTSNGATVNLSTDGNFTYRGAANWNGTDSFSYTITDGNGGTATATATVDVAPIDELPVDILHAQIQAGINGSDGVNAVGIGASGGWGSTGGSAAAETIGKNLTGQDGDDNLMISTGVSGGSGGHGGDGYHGFNWDRTISPGTVNYHSGGGAAGHGGLAGHGGDADASSQFNATQANAGADILKIHSEGTGGNGGSGGDGGAGGDGGIDGMHITWLGGVDTPYKASIIDYFGRSGGAGGIGNNGGNGGQGRAFVEHNTLDGGGTIDSITLSASAFGGDGGQGGNGGRGGDGGAEQSNSGFYNHVGPAGAGGLAGAGGSAIAQISTNNVLGGNGADTISLNATAEGGDGGNGGTGGQAGKLIELETTYTPSTNIRTSFLTHLWGQSGNGGHGNSAGDTQALILDNLVHGGGGDDVIVLSASAAGGYDGIGGSPGYVGYYSSPYWGGDDRYYSQQGHSGVHGGGYDGEIQQIDITGNTIYGDDGNDTIRFETSFINAENLNIDVSGNQVYGGSGVDTLDFSGMSHAVNVDLDAGTFSVDGSVGSNIVDGFEAIIGSSQDDVLYGGWGDDLFVFADGFGNDNVDGGGNADTLDFSGMSHAVNVDLVAGTFSVDGNVGSSTVSNVENVIGSGVNDFLVAGASGGGFLSGGAGNDQVYGGMGDDILNGDSGNDILAGGGSGNDTMSGGSGDDLYYVVGAGDQVVETANGGTDMIYSYTDIDLGNSARYSGFVENVTLLGNAVVASGNGLDNMITGNADLGSILSGQGGDDRFVISNGAGNDTVDGGADTDTLDLSYLSSGVTVSLTTGTFSVTGGGSSTVSNVENVIGSGVNDFLVAGASGGGFLSGGAGNDQVYGGMGDDILNGDSGNDILGAGPGGNNTLIGGTGNDTMYAGDGDDLFVFANGSGTDAIIGFTAGAAAGDKLDVADFGFLDVNAVKAASTQVGANTVIQLDVDDSLTLIGVNVGDLNQDDFLF